MHITLREKIICSQCGSSDYETFSDARYGGKRCKSCGHEKKELHQHLKPESSGSVAFRFDPNKEIKF